MQDEINTWLDSLGLLQYAEVFAGAHRGHRPRRPGTVAALLRPPFALERLEQLADNQLVYRLAKPLLDGRTRLRLTPLELIDRLAALIPPARLHRFRYHEVLEPNAPQRAHVIALTRQPPPPMPNAADALHAPAHSPARYLWALLLARIYELLPPRCTLYGGEMRIIAFLSDASAIHSILTDLGSRLCLRKYPRNEARRCGSRLPSCTGMTSRHPRPRWKSWHEPRITSLAIPAAALPVANLLPRATRSPRCLVRAACATRYSDMDARARRSTRTVIGE